MDSQQDSPLVITGIGLTSSLGCTTRTFSNHLLSGQSGLQHRRLGRKSNETLLGTSPAKVKPVGPKGWPVGRATGLALESARRSLAGARLGTEFDRSRLGVIHCTMHGNLKSLYDYRTEMREYGLGRASPMQFPNTIMHASASYLSIAIQAEAFNLTISNGLISGLAALGRAAQLIGIGACDQCLCVTSEDISLELLSFLSSREEFDAEAADPFGQSRGGYVLGEGSVALLVESADEARRRKVPVLAEILAVAVSSNQPAAGAYSRLTREVLDAASLRPGDIGAVMASARGSDSDAEEAIALADVFGKETPITALKGALGECGSAGPYLAIAAVVASSAQRLCPPTLGRSAYDPRLPAIDLVRKPRSYEHPAFLVNSFDYADCAGVLALALPASRKTH